MTRFILMAAALVSAGVPQLVAQEMLSTGMVLVYATPDGVERPWLVELFEGNVSRGDRSGCQLVRYSAGGPTRDADERITCVAADTVFRWSQASRRWNVARLVAPHDTLDLPLVSGVARYITHGAAIDTVAGIPVPVVHTTVLTVDTLGSVIRRLTERYAPGLGTATWGRFEVPDTEVPGRWQVVQEFRLASIRRP